MEWALVDLKVGCNHGRLRNFLELRAGKKRPGYKRQLKYVDAQLWPDLARESAGKFAGLGLGNLPSRLSEAMN